MTADDLEQLKELASERWGDEWAIRATHFADGTIQAYAFHSRGVVDNNHDAKTLEQERLYADSEQTIFRRVHVHHEDVEVIEERDLEGEDS